MPVEPSNGAHLFKPVPFADQNDPKVVADLAELNALVLTPEAIALAKQLEEEKAESKRSYLEEKSKQSKPPPNYLRAHEAIIDQLLINPGATYGALSKITGYSRAWLSKVISSDAFQAKLAERQRALVDPIILSSIEARLKGTLGLSLDIIDERLEAAPKFDDALATFSAISKAMGMGQKVAAPAVQNQFIVRLPEKTLSAEQWAATHSSNAGLQKYREGASIATDAEVHTAYEAAVAEASFNPFEAVAEATFAEKGVAEVAGGAEVAVAVPLLSPPPAIATASPAAPVPIAEVVLDSGS